MAKTNNIWEQIEESGSFDLGLLLDAAFMKFKIHLKEADSFHLLADQLSQLPQDISTFPRPQSPIRLSNDFLKDDINEPAVFLGPQFQQYSTRISIISAFAALDNFLLSVSMCFEILDAISEGQSFTIKELRKAGEKGFKRAHKPAASEELIKTLGEKYIDPKVLDMISRLKAMRNCIVHRWGIVARKDLNSQDKTRHVFEYLDHGLSKSSTELLKYQHGDIVDHLHTIKRCSYDLDEEIKFNSIECQKILITLERLVYGIFHATIQYCKDSGKVKEVIIEKSV